MDDKMELDKCKIAYYVPGKESLTPQQLSAELDRDFLSMMRKCEHLIELGLVRREVIDNGEDDLYWFTRRINETPYHCKFCKRLLFFLS